MDVARLGTDLTSVPTSTLQRGTPLVHYGLTSDSTREAVLDTASGVVAILVCHGMGQQVRYETISSIAEAIRTEATELGGTSAPVQVHLSYDKGAFLARAELQWSDKTKVDHAVHVYEAYWAPLTEGEVTYRDTILFLLSAAWNGLQWSKLFRLSSFERWMFDGRKRMQIGRATFAGIIAVLVFLALQVALVAFALLTLAQQYRTLLAMPLPAAGSKNFVLVLLSWLGPLFPGFEQLVRPESLGAWLKDAACLLLWIAAIAEAFLARYFIIQYVGDVAAYISPYKDSKFDEIRREIQNIGLNVGKTIYGFGAPQATVPHYRTVVVVGHSLGSVLAYDTLNALINLDNVSEKTDRRDVVARTRALITFGSPLDKTAFIFRMQARTATEWVREQLAASIQPLIVSYEDYRPPTFEWINIWSSMDIISGELNYYDDPERTPNVPPCVQNKPDPEARTFLKAHVQYWKNHLLRQELYRVVSGTAQGG
jgi:hypothetical protein